jgi:transposase
MDKYIGIDVHASSCTIAVVDAHGKQVGSYVVATNGQEIVECLRAIPGQRHVCFEEGTQSGWLYEILEPHAVEVVVAGVEAGRRGPKDDKRDAFGLAEDLRLGAIKTRVFKNGGPYKALRELARTHRMVVRDVVRTKNRIKSMYRSHGVAVAGKSVYSSAGREPWQAQLPEACRGPVRTLYAELDALEEVRDDAEKALVQEARKFPITKLLATCPGLGAIRAAQLVPIVVSPHRFRTKRQFWSYCGLGIVMRSSSDWVRDKNEQWQRAQVQQTRGLNLTHNHHLKAIFKGAATTVIAQHPDEPLNLAYQHWLAAGTKPNLAKVSLARKIATIALMMWKTEEEYDSSKHSKTVSP